MKYLGGLISFIFIVPISFIFCAEILYAQSITEVFFKQEEAGSQYSFVEIHNTTSNSIDLTSYKIKSSVDGSKHRINSFRGGDIIPAGAIAIIAKSPSDFISKFSNFSGRVFGAALSSIKKTKAATLILLLGESDLSTVSYSDTEASSITDGYSLHISETLQNFFSIPTPGIISTVPVNSFTNPSTISQTPQIDRSKNNFSKIIKIEKIVDGYHLETLPRVIVSNTPVKFKLVEVFNATQRRSVRADWNFGDGTTKTGLEVSHVYVYPGRYIISALISKEKDIYIRKEITVQDLMLKINRLDNFFIHLKHNSPNNLDVSGWSIESGEFSTSIPPRTFLLPNIENVLRVETELGESIKLFNENNFPLKLEKIKQITNKDDNVLLLNKKINFNTQEIKTPNKINNNSTVSMLEVKTMPKNKGKNGIGGILIWIVYLIGFIILVLIPFYIPKK